MSGYSVQYVMPWNPVNPNHIGGGGGIVPCGAKNSEKCLCSHNNTDLIKKKHSVWYCP